MGRPPENAIPGIADTTGIVEGCIAEELGGNGSRLGSDELAVHHVECLRGNVGLGATVAGGGGVAEIEEGENAGQIGAAQGQIDGSALALVRLHAHSLIAEFRVAAAAGEEGTSDSKIERSIQLEERVANLFDFEAAGREAGKQGAVRVAFQSVGRSKAGHLVSVGQHQEAVHGFDGPPAFDE